MPEEEKKNKTIWVILIIFAIVIASFVLFWLSRPIDVDVEIDVEERTRELTPEERETLTDLGSAPGGSLLTPEERETLTDLGSAPGGPLLTPEEVRFLETHSAAN